MQVRITMTPDEIRDACADWMNSYAGTDTTVEARDVELRIEGSPAAPVLVAEATYTRGAT